MTDKKKEKYKLIVGERRFRAVRDWTKETNILARIIEASDQKSCRMGLIENLQREDLCALEEINGIVGLIDITLISDISYLPSEKTPLKRVHGLLASSNIVRLRKGCGDDTRSVNDHFGRKLTPKIEEIFRNLPKKLKWQSFYRNDLPLLLGICEKVQKDAIELRLNKSQIIAPPTHSLLFLFF